MSLRQKVQQGLFWVGFGALGLYLLLLVHLLQPPGPHLKVEAIARIQFGMSEDEVVAILGMPPGDYSTPPDSTQFRIKTSGCGWRSTWENRPLYKLEAWKTDQHHLFLGFDECGLLVSKDCHGAPQSTRSSLSSFIQRFRDVWTWLWSLV